MIKYINLVTKKQKLPTPTKLAGSFKDRNKNYFISRKGRKRKEGKEERRKKEK